MASERIGSSSPLDSWALDREIVLSRVIAAPRELVFKVWTDPQHLPMWFGPEGFKVETHEIDIASAASGDSSSLVPTARAMTTAWCS